MSSSIRNTGSVRLPDGIASETVTVVVRAVDHDGNESAAVVTREQVLLEDHYGHRDRTCGAAGMMALLSLVPIAVLVAVLVFGVLLLFRMSRRPGDATPEPISLLAAETIARDLLHLSLALTALGMLCTVGALALAVDDVLGVVVGFAPLFGVRNVWKCRRALSLIPDATTPPWSDAAPGSSSEI